MPPIGDPYSPPGPSLTKSAVTVGMVSYPVTKDYGTIMVSPSSSPFPKFVPKFKPPTSSPAKKTSPGVPTSLANSRWVAEGIPKTTLSFYLCEGCDGIFLSQITHTIVFAAAPSFIGHQFYFFQKLISRRQLWLRIIRMRSYGSSPEPIKVWERPGDTQWCHFSQLWVLGSRGPP